MSFFAFTLVSAAASALAECGYCSRNCKCGCNDGPATLLQWDMFFNVDAEPAPADDEPRPLELDRPDFTEASSTVGRGNHVLEFGYTYFRDENARETFNGHSFPEALLRVGVLTEWLELRLGQNFASENTTTPAGRDSAAGAQDIYLGMKLGLFEQAGVLPEVAIVPQMRAPSGDAEFTADEVLPGVNLLYGWELSENWSLGASTQGNRVPDSTGEFYLEFAQSVTLGRSLTDELGMYYEWFVLAPHDASDPAVATEHYFDTGVTYLMSENFQVDARIGVGLNREAANLFTGFGAGYRW